MGIQPVQERRGGGPGQDCGQGFPNVSLAMCPLKFSLAPYLLDSGARTVGIWEPLKKLYNPFAQ